MKTIEAPIIENERDLDEALARVEALIDSGDEAHADEIRILSMVIWTFEDEHFPIGDSSPIRIIRFFMEQKGYTNKDLARVLGDHSRVSEVMNGKRSLSIHMIRNLHAAWKIRLNCLIEPTESASGAA